MKKKFIITLATLLLIVSGAVNAAVTTDTITWDSSAWQQSTVNATFALTFVGATPLTINSASLDIRAYDVKTLDQFDVSLDGTALGKLGGAQFAWSVTTLDAISAIDGTNASPALQITGLSKNALTFCSYG